jgi:hypothetical protein
LRRGLLPLSRKGVEFAPSGHEFGLELSQISTMRGIRSLEGGVISRLGYDLRNGSLD